MFIEHIYQLFFIKIKIETILRGFQKRNALITKLGMLLIGQKFKFKLRIQL